MAQHGHDNLGNSKETQTVVTNREPIRVLLFNCWPKGMDRFAKFIDADTSGETEYQLLHYGFYYDRTRPLRETIHGYLQRGLPCVDIRTFPGMGFEEIVRSLTPNVVLLGSINSLFDRIMYLACRKLGIPTIFLQHGSWTDPDQVQDFLESLDDGWTFKDRLMRIPKFLRSIPWYVKARGGFDAELWNVLWRNIKEPTMSQFFPSAPEELWPTVALTYNKASADILTDTHRLPPDRIRVVGNPELDGAIARRARPLARSERDALVRSFGLDPDAPILCWIEDGFVEQQNCFGWTEERRVDTLRELYAACQNASVQLLIRPHPTSVIHAMEQELTGKPCVAMVRTATLLDMVDASDAVLGTGSTALETAVVLAKPLLVPLWYFQEEASKGPYVRYGVATALQSPGELADAIGLAVRGELPATDSSKFFEERLGPTDGSANLRVVAAILELGRQHRGCRPAAA